MRISKYAVGGAAAPRVFDIETRQPVVREPGAATSILDLEVPSWQLTAEQLAYAQRWYPEFHSVGWYQHPKSGWYFIGVNPSDPDLPARRSGDDDKRIDPAGPWRLVGHALVSTGHVTPLVRSSGSWLKESRAGERREYLYRVVHPEAHRSHPVVVFGEGPAFTPRGSLLRERPDVDAIGFSCCTCSAAEWDPKKPQTRFEFRACLGMRILARYLNRLRITPENGT